ncbi:hypothetical protein LXL04_001785 [Taraxacum kok-saghyz]
MKGNVMKVNGNVIHEDRFYDGIDGVELFKFYCNDLTTQYKHIIYVYMCMWCFFLFGVIFVHMFNVKLMSSMSNAVTKSENRRFYQIVVREVNCQEAKAGRGLSANPPKMCMDRDFKRGTASFFLLLLRVNHKTNRNPKRRSTAPPSSDPSSPPASSNRDLVVLVATAGDLTPAAFLSWIRRPTRIFPSPATVPFSHGKSLHSLLLLSRSVGPVDHRSLMSPVFSGSQELFPATISFLPCAVFLATCNTPSSLSRPRLANEEHLLSCSFPAEEEHHRGCGWEPRQPFFPAISYFLPITFLSRLSVVNPAIKAVSGDPPATGHRGHGGSGRKWDYMAVLGRVHVVALLVVFSVHSSFQVSSLTVVIVFIIARLVRERLRKFIVIVCIVC